VTASLANSWAMIALVAIPREVAWSYFMFALVLTVGVAAISYRGDWHNARGLDKLLLFGPLFYAAPLAGFGTEHFTLPQVIASFIPAWIPWHLFWTYLVGASFIVAAFSLVTGIQRRLSASLLAVTFVLFVILMDAPGWARHPRDRFALALLFRELSFSAGPLALAATFSCEWRQRGTHVLATVARYCIAVPVLYYSLEQILHADHVPGIPLEMVTPQWLFGHAVWTYVAAAAYAIAGALLLLNKRSRTAATWVGLTVLVVEVLVYLPIAVVERTSLEGFNYMADTLMYCGTVLLLAGALPRPALADRPLGEQHGQASHTPDLQSVVCPPQSICLTGACRVAALFDFATMAALTRSAVNGTSRSRTPVASAMALPMAAGTTVIAVSPAPVAGTSARFTNVISIEGTSIPRYRLV